MDRFKNKIEAAAYLAGMIDGEGHVRHGLKQDGERTVSKYKAIQITNTDMELLEACQDACDLLGIEWRIHAKVRKEGMSKDGHYRKACHVLWIMRRENLMKVQKLVPLQSKQKKDALDLAISSYQRIPGKKWIPSEDALEAIRAGQRRRRERERLEKT